MISIRLADVTEIHSDTGGISQTLSKDEVHDICAILNDVDLRVLVRNEIHDF